MPSHEGNSVKSPFRLDRPRRSGRAAPAIPIEEFDGFETLAPDPALEPFDVLYVEDEAVQEIAEQTTYGEILLQDLIRRQLALGLRVAGVFLVFLFALPLVNRLFPDLVGAHLLGLPLSWLVLAVLIYPMLWALGSYFVATARKYEDDFTELVRK